MVTSFMRDMMPNHLITKDLFLDLAYFDSDYQGRKLADNLDFGFEMTYWQTPQTTLPNYVSRGMSPKQLLKGFWPPQSNFNLENAVAYIKDAGYRGVSTFDWESARTVACTAELTTHLYGGGNWNPAEKDTSTQHKDTSAEDTADLPTKDTRSSTRVPLKPKPSLSVTQRHTDAKKAVATQPHTEAAKVVQTTKVASRLKPTASLVANKPSAKASLSRLPRKVVPKVRTAAARPPTRKSLHLARRTVTPKSLSSAASSVASSAASSGSAKSLCGDDTWELI